MSDFLITFLLWFGALGCGLLAGVYFAFSAFIMRALGGLNQEAGVLAMNSINSTILRSWFMPFFYGTTFASLLLAIAGVARIGNAGAAPMIAGGLIYIVGMFVCTIVRNVPLNNELAAVAPASTSAAPVWQRYLRQWTWWNHVRTTSCTAACAFYIAAIAASGH